MESTRKYSKKREAILELLRSTAEHPSADWIYAQLKPAFPDLSLGTVYRNIGLFLEDGTVVSVGTVDGRERYDAHTHGHAHFICECCGHVCDVDSPTADALTREAARDIEGEVHSHKLSFLGLCPGCLERAGH